MAGAWLLSFFRAQMIHEAGFKRRTDERPQGSAATTGTDAPLVLPSPS
jgi:hypothetical protein